MLNALKANLEKKEIYDFYSTDAEEEIMKQSAKGKHIYVMNGNLIYAIPGFPVKEVSEFRLTSKDEQFLKNLCTEIDALYCISFKAIEYLFPDSLKNNQLKIENIRNILAYNTNETFTSEIKNLFFKNFLKSTISDMKLLNDIYLQGELFTFYNCKANLDLKDIYIDHIIFLLKNNINFYNNLETCGCPQRVYKCNFLWNELWQNKIRSNTENIQQNYVTDLMLIHAANNLWVGGDEKYNYIDYLKGNNLLNNKEESFNLISKLFKNVDTDKDDVYKLGSFNIFINKFDIKHSLDIKDFDYFSILAENGFIERLYKMSQNDRLDQYTAMRATYFEQSFPNSKNKDIVKNIGRITQGRYSAYVNEKNEYLSNYLGFGRKASSSSSSSSSSNSSDNEAKQGGSKSNSESDFDKCERINVPSIKKVGERGVSGFSYTYLIEFSDGIYGTLYLGDPSNKYFISDGIRNYYYKSYSSALNALYRYKKCEFISKIDRD